MAILAANQLIQADSSGLVFHYHAGQPDKYKRWTGATVLADGTAGGAMFVGYRIANFDSSNTGWTDYTFDLTTRTQEKTFYINKTSQQLQVRLSDFSGKEFDARECNVIEAEVDPNVQAEFSGLVWEFDGGRPDLHKRWPKLSIAAEGTSGGGVYVGYRTSDFDGTATTAWTDFTFDLTDDVQEKTFYINKTSKRIQVGVRDFSNDSQFHIRDLNVIA